MSSESNNKGTQVTPQETIKTIYDEVMTSGAEVGGRLKTLFEENSDQYLVVRDGEGRVLIKLSLLGGIMLAVFSLVLNRLRWLPLLAIALSLVHMQMTLETDKDTRAKSSPASKRAPS